MHRIFPYLSDEEERALLEKGGVSRFSPGSAIVREGDHHNAIYVLRVGHVRVEKNSAGFPLELARLGPWEIFGEMSFQVPEHLRPPVPVAGGHPRAAPARDGVAGEPARRPHAPVAPRVAEAAGRAS